MNLDQKDMICITRILQSVLFKGNESIFYGCKYCEYQKECAKSIRHDNESIFYFDIVRKKLQTITGLDLTIISNGDVKARFQKRLK